MSSNNQIGLTEAIAWTNAFRQSKEGQTNNANAFLIPTKDLMGMLVEMNILRLDKDNWYYFDPGTGNDIRAYLAVDPTQTSAGGQKLVMVATQKLPDYTNPTQYVHKDIINGKIDNKQKITPDPNIRATEAAPEPNTGIYDFSRPCPNYCDPDSPLA